MNSNSVLNAANEAPKAAAHYAAVAPKVAGQRVAQAPALANRRAKSFAKAMHRPSYIRPMDPEDVEKGIIGGGKGWRVRGAKEGYRDDDDEETRIGSEQSSSNEKQTDPYDFPATYTKKSTDKEGNEVILLKFVEGDREDPLNWSKAYKWWVKQGEQLADVSELIHNATQVHHRATLLYDLVHRESLRDLISLRPFKWLIKMLD